MASIETKALESEAQARIIEALTKAGYQVFRSTCSRAGDPDLLAKRGMVNLAIEVKAHIGKKVGLWQCKRLIDYKNAGYVANVVFGYDDFIEKFGGYL